MMNIYIKERYRIMRNMISSDLNSVIVDLGAGNDPISDGFLYKKRIKVDGDKLSNPDIVHDLNEPIPIKNNYADIVICGEVLEHLINPFRFLLEVNRILKANGQLIISTPNIACLKNRILLAFGQMPSNNAKPHPIVDDHIFCHKSDFTLKLLRDFLKKAEFEILKSSSNGIIFKNKVLVKGEICPTLLGEILILKAMKK